jgi:hypothetical protein
MLLEVYVVVNFRTRRINRGVCKLAWKPTLIKKKKGSKNIGEAEGAKGFIKQLEFVNKYNDL